MTSLKPSYLTSHTPVGFFHSLRSNDKVDRFLVADLPAGRYALALDPLGNNPDHLFLALPLAEDGIRWSGTGDVVTSPSGVVIKGRQEDWQGSSLNVPVEGGQPKQDDRPIINYTRWRLIQRDRDDAPIVLFEREPAER